MSELEWPNIVGRPLVGLPGATMARAPFWRPLVSPGGIHWYKAIPLVPMGPLLWGTWGRSEGCLRRFEGSYGWGGGLSEVLWNGGGMMSKNKVNKNKVMCCQCGAYTGYYCAVCAAEDCDKKEHAICGSKSKKGKDCLLRHTRGLKGRKARKIAQSK